MNDVSCYSYHIISYHIIYHIISISYHIISFHGHLFSFSFSFSFLFSFSRTREDDEKDHAMITRRNLQKAAAVHLVTCSQYLQTSSSALQECLQPLLLRPSSSPSTACGRSWVLLMLPCLLIVFFSSFSSSSSSSFNSVCVGVDYFVFFSFQKGGDLFAVAVLRFLCSNGYVCLDGCWSGWFFGRSVKLSLFPFFVVFSSSAIIYFIFYCHLGIPFYSLKSI